MGTKTNKGGPGKVRNPSLLRINSDITKSTKSSGKTQTHDGASRHKASATTTKRKQKSAATVMPRMQAANDSARHTRTARKKEVASATNPELRIDSEPTGDAEVERAVQFDHNIPLAAIPSVDV